MKKETPKPKTKTPRLDCPLCGVFMRPLRNTLTKDVAYSCSLCGSLLLLKNHPPGSRQAYTNARLAEKTPK